MQISGISDYAKKKCKLCKLHLPHVKNPFPGPCNGNFTNIGVVLFLSISPIINTYSPTCFFSMTPGGLRPSFENPPT